MLAARRAPLHVELQCMTGCACPACDAAGQAKPFPSTKELRTHVERVHRKQLCVTCVHVRQLLLLPLHYLPCSTLVACGLARLYRA